MEKIALKPASVFNYIDEICQVPRPSKKEEKMLLGLHCLMTRCCIG